MKSTGKNCRRCLPKRPDNAHRFSDDSYSFDYWGISNLAENPQQAVGLTAPWILNLTGSVSMLIAGRSRAAVFFRSKNTHVFDLQFFLNPVLIT
jgi:hypothetical protein